MDVKVTKFETISCKIKHNELKEILKDQLIKNGYNDVDTSSMKLYVTNGVDGLNVEVVVERKIVDNVINKNPPIPAKRKKSKLLSLPLGTTFLYKGKEYVIEVKSNDFVYCRNDIENKKETFGKHTVVEVVV